MKTVLIVSPRFPPSIAPDYHRVRMLLPLLEQYGWRAVVLCVRSDFVVGGDEPGLRRTIPDWVEVVECRAIPAQWSRRAGIGSLALRAGLFLRSAGDRLLRHRGFDLVFFSTTEFLLLALGPHWLREFKVPFVVDFQDPWVNPYYDEQKVPPPGGRFKHAVHQGAARYLEKRVVRAAAQIITVSPHYPFTLMRRYADLPEAKFSVIPFGGGERDFEKARDRVQSIFASGDGRMHWVSAGVVAPGSHATFTAFFDAFRRAGESGIFDPDSVRLHFIGTDYGLSAQPRQQVMPLAEACGVATYVEEHPSRIAYLEALRCLLDADALLIFGSKESGYTPSRLFSCILARKPLLTIFHQESSVTQTMRELHAGVSVAFDGTTARDELARSVFDQWFVQRGFEAIPATSWDAFRPYSAESMAERVAEVFERAVG